MSQNPTGRGGGTGPGRGQDVLPHHPRGGSNVQNRASGESTRSSQPKSRPYEPMDPKSMNAKVKEIEMETEQNILNRGPNSPSSIMPLRMGYGTRGRPVELFTNYFQVDLMENIPLYRYAITIQPDSAGRAPVGKAAKRIIELLREEHLQLYQTVTDFKMILLSKQLLELWKDGYLVTYKIENEDDPAPNAKQYRVRLTNSGSISLSDLLEYLNSPQIGLTMDSKAEIIQALNIILGDHPKMRPDIINVGANRYFDKNPSPADRALLGGGVEVIRGIFMSGRPATARLVANVQVKNTAFYAANRADKLIRSFLREIKYDRNNKLDRFLKRLRVDALHLVKTNAQGYRIPRATTVLGLANPHDGRKSSHPPIVPQHGASSKEVKFFLPDAPNDPSKGKFISVYSFFHQKYAKTLVYPDLPVLNVGSPDKPVYLPAEVCNVVRGQPLHAKLSPEQTTKMISFAVRPPTDNMQTILAHGARLPGFRPSNSTLQAFGIDVVPELLTVPARVLNAPKVKYGAKKDLTPKFGTWNLQGVQFARTSTKSAKWAWLHISLEANPSQTGGPDFETAYVGFFEQEMKKLGIKLNKCMGGMHFKASRGNLESAINNKIDRFNSVPESRPGLLLVVVPDQEKTLVYNRVKYACEVKFGLVNICVLDSKFKRAFKNKDAQYMANVGLKINLKFGGQNHSLEPSALGIIGEKKTMVVGIDVTHPSPGSTSTAPSVVGIVASVDEWLGQWPGELRIQTARQEMVDDLDMLFQSRLKLWSKGHNGSFPDNILVYRDGVSEGQYETVTSTELPALRKACTTLYPATMTKANLPRLTIIIAGKRHHTRFYPKTPAEAEKSGNLASGTVVDRGLTEARTWDFFLKAHGALQGTAKPAHYIVIHDEIFGAQKVQAPSKNAADTVQDLTHNLCYLFGRATKAVSVCPPAYYADLLCTRARCYLSSVYDPDDNSSQGAGGAGTGRVPDAAMVKIHDDVRDSMFYI